MNALNTPGTIRNLMMGIFFSAALLAWGAAEALAYCVYNDTEQYISEVAGEFCMRCLNTSMSPHGKACCPGDKSGCRGETRITVRVPNTVYQSGAHYKHFGAKVTAHDWVRIQGSMYAPSGVVYNDDGALLWSGPLIDGK